MDIAALPLQSDCEFYHSIDLPGVGSIEGRWDLRGRFDEYSGHIPGDVDLWTFVAKRRAPIRSAEPGEYPKR